MEQYVKYLRKSRFDRDYAELSIEETLKRHEAILDKLAAERGYYIAKTYYEVVSGESIAARPEIQKMLEEVNAGFYAVATGRVINKNMSHRPNKLPILNDRAAAHE